MNLRELDVDENQACGLPNERVQSRPVKPALRNDEAVFHYTCARENVGATVELSFNGNRVQGKVADVHDPPLHGAENDRVPRNESYVKDFKPLRLGTLRMEKGRGKLTLRAVEIPGKEVMDVRLIMLTLIE